MKKAPAHSTSLSFCRPPGCVPGFPAAWNLLVRVVLGFIAWSSGTSCLGAEDLAGLMASRIEMIKKFSQSPPAIEDFIFTYTMPPSISYDKAGKALPPRTNAPIYYRGSWSSNAFVLVEVPSLEEIETIPLAAEFTLLRGNMVIRNGDAFWAVSGGAKSFTRWDGVLPEKLDRNNPVMAAYHNTTFRFFTLLNMGVHFVSPGAIHWSSNQFSLITQHPNEEFHIMGEIASEASSFPILKLVFKSNTVFGKHEVRYSYLEGSLLPSNFPSRIASVVFTDNGPTANHDLEIRSLKPANNPASGLSIDPLPWLKSQSFTEFVFTNNQLFAVEPGRGMRLVRRPDRPAPPALLIAHANRYYFAAAGGITLGFFILILRMRKTEKTNKNHSHPTELI